MTRNLIVCLLALCMIGIPELSIAQDKITRTYIVREQDNLFKIALANKVNLDALARENKIKAPDYIIYPGQKLTITIGIETLRPLSLSKDAGNIDDFNYYQMLQYETYRTSIVSNWKTESGSLKSDGLYYKVLKNIIENQLTASQWTTRIENTRRQIQEYMTQMPKKESIYILSFAVDSIRNDAKSGLEYVDSSAIKFVRCFERLEGTVYQSVHSEVKVGLLTRAEILLAITNFLLQIKEEDPVIFIYIGAHAIPDLNTGSICPFNYDTKAPCDSTISPEALYGAINKYKPGNINAFLFLDVCFADRIARPIYNLSYGDDSNISVFAASGYSERSYEGPAIRNSSFVAAFEIIMKGDFRFWGNSPFQEGVAEDLMILVPLITAQMDYKKEGLKQTPKFYHDSTKRRIRFH